MDFDMTALSPTERYRLIARAVTPHGSRHYVRNADRFEVPWVGWPLGAA